MSEVKTDTSVVEVNLNIVKNDLTYFTKEEIQKLIDDILTATDGNNCKTSGIFKSCKLKDNRTKV